MQRHIDSNPMDFPRSKLSDHGELGEPTLHFALPRIRLCFFYQLRHREKFSCLGCEAMEMLARVIEGEEQPGRQVILPVKLLVRKTCGAKLVRKEKYIDAQGPL